MDIPQCQGYTPEQVYEDEPVDASCRSAVLTILSKAAEKAVAEAIVQHNQNGGGKVTAARVTIKPANIQLSSDSVAVGSVPDLSYKFEIKGPENGGTQTRLKCLHVIPTTYPPSGLKNGTSIAQTTSNAGEHSYQSVLFDDPNQPVDHQASYAGSQVPWDLCSSDRLELSPPSLCWCGDLQDCTIKTSHKFCDLNETRSIITGGRCYEAPTCLCGVSSTNGLSEVPKPPCVFSNRTDARGEGNATDFEDDADEGILETIVGQYGGKNTAPDVRCLINDILKLAATRRHFEVRRRFMMRTKIG